MRLEVEIRKSLAGAGRRVDIDVRFDSEASRLVLFGASGAGKTLTLQAIAGLVAPDAGRIVHDGEVWFDGNAGIDVAARRRGVGLMFQDYALFPHRTVAENIGAVHARRWTRAINDEAQSEVELLLERFDYDDLLRLSLIHI